MCGRENTELGKSSPRITAEDFRWWTSPIDLQENELSPVCIVIGDADRRRTGALKGKQPFGKYLELQHDSAAFLCSRDPPTELKDFLEGDLNTASCSAACLRLLASELLQNT